MKKTGYFLLAVIVIVAAAGVGYWKFSGNPDALRKSCLNNACPISYSIKTQRRARKSNLALAMSSLKIVTVRCNIY
ncbi:hypothetical protein RB531_2811 [Salmonella enterica subsp. enterica serovar Typhimurium]